MEEFGPAPRHVPESYPGRRPDTSFVFCGNHIVPIHETAGKKIEESLNFHSDIAAAPSKQDRYMVVGYGSNACPAQLKSKFSESDPMPVLRATLNDCDVVYAPFFASYGSVPATITRSPGTTVDVWVNVLHEKQIEVMDASEGRGNHYMLAEIDAGLTLKNGESFSPVYAYVGTGGVLCIDNQVISLAEVHATGRRFRALSQKDMLETLCGMLADDAGWQEAQPPPPCDASEFAHSAARNSKEYGRILSEKYSADNPIRLAELPHGTRPLRIEKLERQFG